MYKHSGALTVLVCVPQAIVTRGKLYMTRVILLKINEKKRARSASEKMIFVSKM